MFRAALIVLSDRAARGERADGCMTVMREKLGTAYDVVRERVLADERRHYKPNSSTLPTRRPPTDSHRGGTGLSPRDRTPQATAAILDYQVPGIAEAIRAASTAFVKTAMLSRALAGVRHRTLIVNLPGSPKAVAESLDVVLPVLPHAFELLGDRVVDG